MYGIALRSLTWAWCCRCTRVKTEKLKAQQVAAPCPIQRNSRSRLGGALWQASWMTVPSRCRAQEAQGQQSTRRGQWAHDQPRIVNAGESNSRPKGHRFGFQAAGGPRNSRGTERGQARPGRVVGAH